MRSIYAVSLFCLALFCPEVRSASAGQGYSVQVETLSFEPAARAVVSRLRARGYDAFFESTQAGEGRVLYKVRFGHFTTRAEADAAAHAYRRQEQRDCFVVRIMLPVGTAPPRAAGALPDTPAAAAGDQGGSGMPPRITPEQPVPVTGHAQPVVHDKEFYTVQIAAKADRTVAQVLADRLIRTGYPAYVLEPDPADAQPFYRVRIGRYETRAQAEQVGHSYAARERGDFLVVLSPPGRLGEADAQETMTSAPPAAKEYVFTVQLCVRETRESAEMYAARVRAKGFDPYIVRYEAPGGKILYRVRMGSFPARTQAEELVRAYELQGGRDYLVVRTEQEMPSAPAPVPVVPVAAAQQTSAVPEPEMLPEFPPEADVPEQKPPATAQNPDISGLDVQPETTAGWPETVTRVYAYAGPDNELNLTNAYAGIPRDMVGRIQYVSVFPVRFVAVADDARFFVLDVEGARRRLLSAGIRLPEQAPDYAASGITQLLAAEPLRLRHSPDEGGSVLTGSLYFRSGADVQIELIKRGLALIDEARVPAGRLNEFESALRRARDLKAGIWAADDN